MLVLSTVNDKKALLREIKRAAKDLTPTELAKKSGLNRCHLYHLLSEDGNPTLENLLRLCNAPGFKRQ